MDAPSDTWTVATNSLPDEIKYFVQLYDEAPLSAYEVDMNKIKNSGPV